MRLIKIINGTYGYRPAGARSIEPRQAGDPSFPVEDEEASRLVGLGVAVYVDESAQEAPSVVDQAWEALGIKGVATGVGAGIGNGEGEYTPVENDGVEDGEGAPSYDVGMKANELRGLMEECGLVYKVGMTKAHMVATLNKHFRGEGVEDGEAPPALTAEEPIA